MRVTFGLRVFWSAICAAVISGCGAHGNTPELPSPSSFTSPSLRTSSTTFHFTRTAQTFKVPPRVTQLTIDAYGARGGADMPHYYCYIAPGARGAAVEATIRVRPGQVLTVYVGSEGIRGNGGKYGGGGWNGGGGSPSRHGGLGGGGSSDVRIGAGRLRDRIIVAAGGGGAGHDTIIFYYSRSPGCFPGGAGGQGGLTGSNGSFGYYANGSGGFGASQTAGGAGGHGGPKNCNSSIPYCYTYYFPCNGNNGNKGTRLQGGWGASSCQSGGGEGGGGGGGYYGGGGGGGGGCCYDGFFAVSAAGGGGGGGSSFVEKSATGVKVIAGGGPKGNGLVTIRW